MKRPPFFRHAAEAIKAGAVDQVLGIDDIYAAIEKRVLGICRNRTAGSSLMRLRAPKAEFLPRPNISSCSEIMDIVPVSSVPVQEVRSARYHVLFRAAVEISAPGIRKVATCGVGARNRSLFTCSCQRRLLWLACGRRGIAFWASQTLTALLIGGIDKMTTMTRLQALPLSFFTRNGRGIGLTCP